MSEELKAALIDEILIRYHQTRIAGTPVAKFILQSPAVQSRFDALAAPRAPMSDDEIMRRAEGAARHVAAQLGFNPERAIERDAPAMLAAVVALRNIDTPLTPTIDERMAALSKGLGPGVSVVDLLKQAYEMGRKHVD